MTGYEFYGDLLPSTTTYISIKEKPYPNPDGLYEVYLTNYGPYRYREYLTHQDRVDELLGLIDFGVIVEGGQVIADGSWDKLAHRSQCD